MKGTKMGKGEKPTDDGKKDREACKAKFALMPSVNAASVIANYHGNVTGEDVDLWALVEGLRKSFERTNSGDLSELEAMLIAQAVALQTMFTSLARRAQTQQYQRNLEAFISLALKAQAQSRATIQAVIELKNPRQTAFVQQANISHGPQQVNNNNAVQSDKSKEAPARKKQIHQNELLEDQSNGCTQLDARTATTTGRSHSPMETMEAVYRCKNR